MTDRNFDRCWPSRRRPVFSGHDDLRKTGSLRQRPAPTVNLVGMNIRLTRDIRHRRARRERRQNNRTLLLSGKRVADTVQLRG